MGDLTRLFDLNATTRPLCVPQPKASYFHLKAAAGLQCQGHKPGAELQARFGEEQWTCALQWERQEAAEYMGLSTKRVVELGAEALALATAHARWGWRARRRLDEYDFADWLLMDDDKQLIALEVSGCGKPDKYRMAKKLAQVSKHKEAKIKIACVVEFATPRADFAQARSECA